MTADFDLLSLLSERAKARKMFHFKNAGIGEAPQGFVPHPKPIGMNWGTPNEGFFPIESMELKVLDYPFQKSLALPLTNASLESLATTLTWSAGEGQPNGGLGAIENLRKLSVNDMKGSKNTVLVQKHTDKANQIDLATGLQYSNVDGHSQLLQFTREFTTRVNKPAYDEWSTIMTTGSGDGLNKAVDAILNPGDVILIEEFTFTPFLMNVHETGGIPVPLKLDLNTAPGTSNGLDLNYLVDLLENWDTRHPELTGRRPKALYTICSGQNPTGLTQSFEFRKKVYALAEKYNFLIIEDDPYGYISLPPFRTPEGFMSLEDFITVDEYLADHLTPSYLKLDTKGRVIRIETFSKLFAPGLRLGFMVAHKNVIDVVRNHSAVVTRFPSGPSQIILNNVLEQKFGGIDGWIQWILKIRATYARRRDVLLNALYDLPAYEKGYIDIIDPRAGMFVAVIIKFPPSTDIISKMSLLDWKLRSYGASVVQGLSLSFDSEFSAERSNFFRLTICSAEDLQQLIEGAKRLTDAVENFFAKGLEF